MSDDADAIFQEIIKPKKPQAAMTRQQQIRARLRDLRALCKKYGRKLPIIRRGPKKAIDVDDVFETLVIEDVDRMGGRE